MGLPARRSMDEGDSLRAPDPRISAALRFIEANLHDSSLAVASLTGEGDRVMRALDIVLSRAWR